jgi:hypothetical protein
MSAAIEQPYLDLTIQLQLLLRAPNTPLKAVDLAMAGCMVQVGKVEGNLQVILTSTNDTNKTASNQWGVRAFKRIKPLKMAQSLKDMHLSLS